MTAAPHAQGPDAASVLVVDDEEIVAEELAAGLARFGFRARHSACPLRALEMLAAAPEVSVLVSDLRMPGMDGLTLARTAMGQRDATSLLAVVLITADGDRGELLESLRGAVSGFVRKPFRVAQVAEAVRIAHEETMRRRAALSAAACC
jgi:CheY-like chemotaxis protein